MTARRGGSRPSRGPKSSRGGGRSSGGSSGSGGKGAGCGLVVAPALGVVMLALLPVVAR